MDLSRRLGGVTWPRTLLLIGAGAAVVLGACQAPVGKDSVKRQLQAGLTADGDIPDWLASCIVDGFVDPMTDAEARAYAAQDDLTPEQRRRIDELTTACIEARRSAEP